MNVYPDEYKNLILRLKSVVFMYSRHLGLSQSLYNKIFDAVDRKSVV